MIQYRKESKERNMKKIVISLVALAAALPAIADSSCGCKEKTCNKQKKVRVVYVGAANAAPVAMENMVAEPIAEPVMVEPVAYEPVAYAPAPKPVRTYTPHARSNWYLGGRVGADMLTWKNKYRAPADVIASPDDDHDNYTFEPVFGADLFLGYHFTPAIRGDIEIGYMSEFSDTDNGYTFNMSTFYGTFNAYYDFINSFYLGGGIGFAFPRVSLDGMDVEQSGSESDLSMIFALMGGYTWDLSENVVLDLRYRLSGHWGPTFNRTISRVNPATTFNLETDVGFVLDNQFTIGLRYEF